MKKRTILINEQNFEVYWKTRIEDRGSGIEDRLKKNEIRVILDRGDVIVDRRLGFYRI